MQLNSKDKPFNFFERHANIIVIISIAFGSLSGVLSKLTTADSIAITFYRLLFALPFFAVPVLLNHRDELMALTKRDVSGCLLAGFFLAAHFFTWLRSVQLTEIASAIVLQALHPLVVLSVTVFIFKRSVKKGALAGIFIALAGAAMIALSDYTGGGDLTGDFLALLGGVFYGLYLCTGNYFRQNIHTNIYVFLVFLFCWLFALAAMLATDTPFTGYPSSDYLWMFIMSMFCQIMAHAVFNWSLGYVSSLYLSTWGNTEIIFSTLLAAIVFSEIPSLWQVFGAAITILGLLLYSHNEK